MPNHCYNRVSFYSDNEREIQEIYDIFENGTNPKTEQTVFGSFIPEPDWSKIPLTENTVKEYSWDKPRGEIGECPKMIIDENQPFRNGLRFESSNVMDDRWYNWRVQNWGTKWDCYDLTIEEDELPNGFQATFNTAWSPPEDIYTAIREKYPDVSISWFYDEPGMEVAGYL